ncbi:MULTISPECIES: DUF2795 domain-containing protein [Mycolicibacterium]|uniref:DUF2795 domain-containing protein n=1 Tax=Mycolicibacterium monacense TaxID=85693 RepID=A0AAD1J2Z8_MYCMB|nr:DUF2795 domain-containing protein [Mycolicibacterium monacense]BBZ64415.1 hypothetical protein MMON_57160 [Mycolicibacterium monacense]
MQKALSGASYPCSKEDLIEHAKSNGADQDILDGLQNCPTVRSAARIRCSRRSSDLLAAQCGRAPGALSAVARHAAAIAATSQ